MNIYIGNFSKDVTEEDLRATFENFGQVATVKLIKDQYSGESRGFGFVEMPSKKQAEEAMNGIKDLKGRMVIINEARPRVEYGNRGGGRGNSRGRSSYGSRSGYGSRY